MIILLETIKAERLVSSSMESIQQFLNLSIPKILGAVYMFIENPEKEMEMEKELRNLTNEFICSIIAEILEEADEAIRNSTSRAEEFNIVKRDNRTLTTTFGDVKFQRTLFISKKTAENIYLLDQHLGLTAHSRLTDGVKLKVIQAVADASYSKAGCSLLCNATVTKNTVKELVHALNFPVTNYEAIKEKREVETLYIEADEDHCSLQAPSKNQKLEVSENGRKLNGIMVKLVYVHEGYEQPKTTKTGQKVKRHRLKNIHYFSGLYEGSENNKILWNEVYEYIENTYDTEKIKHIYFMSDGGSWMDVGKHLLMHEKYVIDEFHLQKYVTKMTGHMKDSADDVKTEILRTIRKGTREEFNELTERIRGYTDKEPELKRIETGATYISENWDAAKIRLTHKKTIIGCSAEGHVSHLLSDRLSSRPRGWSKKGLDNMAKLRAYTRNGSSVEKLIPLIKKADEEDVKKAVGAENQVFSCADILTSERSKNGIIGKYYDCMNVDCPEMIRRMLYSQHGIVLL